ncbi:MAG: serpin family protein [bacterium]
MALLASAACASSVDPGGATSNSSLAHIPDLPRDLTASEQQAVTATNAFSFRLFRQASAAQGSTSMMISPLGAALGLGLAMDGAQGATYDQMRSALSLDAVSGADPVSGVRSLTALLGSLDPIGSFSIGNALWYRGDFPLNPSYAATEAGTRIGALDFASPASVQTINMWASDASIGRIPSIVDHIDSSQSLLLTNTSYFRGNWNARFDPADTHSDVFYAAAGPQAASYMYRRGLMLYYASHDLEAVDLPFGGGAFSMMIVQPRGSLTIDAVAALLEAGAWTDLVGKVRDVGMNLFVPRFRIVYDRTLNADLQGLGVRDAFIPNGADFTRMSPRGRELSLGVVKQKTLIDVNEDGTIASAGGTLVGSTSGFVPLVMRAERPFLFVIRERASGTIVFIGKVMSV